MNRIFLFGVAMFFGLVGVAMIGGEEKAAVAGHKCSCSCASDCGDCGSCACDCSKKRKKRARKCSCACS